MPSSTDCPAPKRSLNARSARASLTAITGTASPPSASSARSRTSPVVVSSVPPSIPSSRSGRADVQRAEQVGAVVQRDPRRPRDDRGHAVGPLVRPARVHLGLARTAPRATSCWIANGFDAHSATSAPPACSVRTSTAVSDVTCRHAPTTTPVERPLAGEALADRAEDGHLPVRPLDPAR